MKKRNYIFLSLLVGVAFTYIAQAAGPTQPDVKAAKIKARKVAMPTEQQIQLIEEAAPDKAPAKSLRGKGIGNTR